MAKVKRTESLLDLLVREEAASRGRGRRVSQPIPEVVDTDRPWKVTPLNEMRGGVDLVDAEMFVPIGTTDAQLRVRAHEMSHVAVTPRVDLGALVDERGLDWDLVQGMEDARIHGMWLQDEDLKEIGSHRLLPKDEEDQLRAEVHRAVVEAKAMGAPMERLRPLAAAFYFSTANTPEDGMFDELVEFVGVDKEVLKKIADQLPEKTFWEMLEMVKDLQELLEADPAPPPVMPGGGKGEGDEGEEGDEEADEAKKKDGLRGHGNVSGNVEIARKEDKAPPPPRVEKDPRTPAQKKADEELFFRQKNVIEVLKRKRDSWVMPPPPPKPPEVRSKKGVSRDASGLEDLILDANELDKNHFAGGERSNGGKWGRMKIEEYPLTVTPPRPRRRNVKRKKLASSRGGYPSNLHRLRTDGKALVRFRKEKRRARTGSLVLDCSGSMAPQPSEIAKALEQAPFAWIALYNGDSYEEDEHRGRGWLRILAAKGKLIPDLEQHIHEFCTRAGDNMVDLPALEVLAKQASPRIWVSDGFATKTKGDHAHGSLECIEFCQLHKIVRIPSLDQVVNEDKADRFLQELKRSRKA